MSNQVSVLLASLVELAEHWKQCASQYELASKELNSLEQSLVGLQLSAYRRCASELLARLAESREHGALDE